MPDPIRVKTPQGVVEFPFGTSPDDITKALSGLTSTSQRQAPGTAGGKPFSAEEFAPSVPKNFTERTIDQAPNLLGALGGAAGFAYGGPPGAAAGAMTGGAVGKTLSNAANAFTGRPAPTSVMGAATDMASSAAQQGALEGAGRLVAAGVGRVAPAIMQSALKPGVRATVAAVRSGKVPPVVQTLLDEGINVTPGGIAKLRTVLDATNDEISAAITPLTAPTTSPMTVASRLSQAARKFGAGGQVNPEADLNAISDAGEEFLRTHPTNLSPAQMQQIKQGTYAILGDKAYGGELKAASVEAQKTLARGLKEEVANEAAQSGVDISGLNLREGKAIDALNAVARRVAVGGNNNPMGLAALAVSHPKTFLTVLMDRSPYVKSMIARGMYQTAENMSGVPANAIRLAVSTLASASEPPAKQEP